MDTPRSTLRDRDLAEISRSAEEARNVKIGAARPPHAERYLHPTADTSYPLEYAFYLLGEIKNKVVLDLGCGHGENLVILAEGGAQVLGLEISPELAELAEQRMRGLWMNAEVRVASAYETGLPDASVDLIFCIAVIHHLDIAVLRAEMMRILKPGGAMVLSEPIRFSKTYDWLRKRLQPRGNISEYEHPVTRAEFACMTEGFQMEAIRYFRLPFVPLLERAVGRNLPSTRRLSNRLLHHFPALNRFATTAVFRLRKAG